MILNADIARREWTARLKEQARQLRVVAVAAETDTMREELSDYADRIERQMHAIETRASHRFTASSADPLPASARC
jgi:hypothetical protein